MNFVEMLENDMIEAMRNKEKDRLMVIRAVKGSMKQEQIDHKREINDELLIEVVSKQIKMRKESISEFEKGNRQDLIDKTAEEVKILEKYLPEQLTEEEIVEILDTAFAEVKPTSPSDMGKIMKEVTPLLKGKADMKVVSQMIKDKLN